MEEPLAALSSWFVTAVLGASTQSSFPSFLPPSGVTAAWLVEDSVSRLPLCLSVISFSLAYFSPPHLIPWGYFSHPGLVSVPLWVGTDRYDVVKSIFTVPVAKAFVLPAFISFHGSFLCQEASSSFYDGN